MGSIVTKGWKPVDGVDLYAFWFNVFSDPGNLTVAGGAKVPLVFNQFVDIDLKAVLGQDWPDVSQAVSMDFGGIMILTSGVLSAIPDIALTFKHPGTWVQTGNYAEQDITVGPQGGSRTNFFDCVGLQDGVFQMSIEAGDVAAFPGDLGGQPWPQEADFGVSCWIKGLWYP